MREGPARTVSYSCEGCRHLIAERIISQGDNILVYYCTATDKKRVLHDAFLSTPFHHCPFHPERLIP